MSLVAPGAVVPINGSVPVTIISAVVTAGLVALATVLIVSHFLRRSRVQTESLAIWELQQLNARFEPLIVRHPSLPFSVERRVNSKAQLERFNLPELMRAELLQYEAWIQQEIDKRTASVEHYNTYTSDVEYARRLLGQSSHPRVRSEKFQTTERKLFEARQLKYPTPSATARATVFYTSPAGRNSYSAWRDWNFDQLRQEFATARQIRARQSTTEALRRRERTLVTPAVRAQIMRRDGYRCRMCGATTDDGAKLHVDHIEPVSRGGTSTSSNLQTLCETCNLGKGNRFAG